MGRMNFLKIATLPFLAIFLSLSLGVLVSGKPSPKHLLVETKDNDLKNIDDVGEVPNQEAFGSIIDRSMTQDYMPNIHTLPKICHPMNWFYQFDPKIGQRWVKNKKNENMGSEG